MKIIDIPGGQGSEAWHRHRAEHFNASDAPAMMGVSPYKTRAELVRELATGIVPEPTPEKARLFADGHRSEGLARPLAEEEIGEDLYPIIVANGRYSASLDGATLDGKILWEHKRLNAMLREAMPPGCSGASLPSLYRVQMEQQLHCAADAERVLFTASEWDADGALVEVRHCWYYPDLALRDQILRGWEQLAEEVANYKPAEAAQVVTATPMEHLPAVSVKLNGALTVASNLEPFGVALRAFIDRIPKKPSTDQEFADTEAACKRLKEAEDRLQQAEDSALAGMADVEAMRRAVAEFRELARTTRLASEKLVKQRKEQIREEEVQRGHLAMTEHIAGLNRRLGGAYIAGLTAGNFGAVIKGLKSLDSVRNAIDTELARAKIEASAMADKIDANLKAIAAAGSPGLFADKALLILKAPDDLAAIIEQRMAAERQRQEIDRERIRQEEAARAQREQERQAQLQSEADERQRAAMQAAAASVEATGVRSGTTLIVSTPAPAGHVEPTTTLTVSHPSPITMVEPPAPPADEKPTLKLGEINDWLAPVLKVDAAGLEALGFVAHRERGAALYKPSDRGRIRLALIEHLEGLK